MSTYNRELWEPVIGLEVHVQLNTLSKLFSSAANHFGDEPNTNISVVCTGQPGSLPVLNRQCVKKAIHFGLAIGAKISPVSTFERKSYFYPDSPRNFQITQMEHPIVVGGEIVTEVDGKKKSFAVNRAHIEDDAGMLKHFSSFAGVDYNRAGVALLEIVSEPVLHSSKEAVAYVRTIKAIMEFIDASDCNMDEGSLRIDANISVRMKGEKNLRNKTEIKNMNSFTFLEMALESEIDRQIKLYTDNPHDIVQELITPGTYRWDSERKETILMRKKEMAEDYRYFPEPDLPPIVLSSAYIEELRRTLPELPQQRFVRYIKEHQLTEYAASILTSEKFLSDFFEEGLKHTSNARSLCNWITVEFAGRLKEKGQTLQSLNLSARNVGKLVKMIDDNTITGKIAKSVADDMVAFPEKDPALIVKENPDYQPIDDLSIAPLIDQIIRENSQSIADYKAGKIKAFAYLVGQVMRLTKGKADPAYVNQVLKEKLDNLE